MSIDLTVPLRALRDGPVARRWHIEDPEVLGEVPEGLDALDVTLEVARGPREGYRARGRLAGSARLECRRCLDPVRVEIDAPVDAWFRPEEEVTPGEEGVFPMPAHASEIDLVPVLREEVWVGLPEYVVCREDCEGLCPRCGARLGVEECDCPPPEPDDRWAALEAVRDRLGGSDDARATTERGSGKGGGPGESAGEP